MPRRKSVAFTENARAVLAARYLRKDDLGQTVETGEELFERVAHAVAQPEGRKRAETAERFYRLMAGLRFIPNSPTLMNAGKPEGQLSACYVLPVRDSLADIFDALKNAALIHQSGGGTGFSFSDLRPQGSAVRTSQGTASGPVSFMRIFDTATDTIKQGGTRRGANMAVLRVDHPDIFEFVESKRDFRSITNFNISVGATEAFMTAVRERRPFKLIDPRTGKPAREIDPGELFDKIVESAWTCGDPGLVFLDRINLFNPTPRAGEMESTNPCGEQPLLPYESCNLGSLNLAAYWRGAKGFDWKRFREDIHLAVRFLDNVIDVNCFPLKSCERITLRNRKIGLGVMGFADLLLMMGVPYGDPDARAEGERLMAFLDREAKHASAELARTRGAFPNWKGSLWEKLGYPPLRNATLSTVAPTGTISIIAGVSSGIEPIYSAVFDRNVLSGQKLRDVHPAVARVYEERGRSVDEVSNESAPEILGKAWSPAQNLSIEAHVRMQAAFQRHSDSAVSKTINLPEAASTEDVRRAYLLAHQTGCKGITIYRDRSRPNQVLEPPRAVEAGSRDQCPVC